MRQLALGMRNEGEMSEGELSRGRVVLDPPYGPHTALTVYLTCLHMAPHTHVLSMGSGSAREAKYPMWDSNSLLKYFINF